MNKGICKLCQLEKELSRESHIFPKFMYQDFDGIHKVDSSKSHYNDHGVRKIPTGVYDSDILCPDCDGRIIGSYETYSSIVLYGSEERPENTGLTYVINEDRTETYRKIDYQKFKLFLLSILWRVSITKQSGFEHSKLSDEHEEKLRKMIYYGDPGEEHEYPINFHSYLKTDIPTDVIFTPYVIGKPKEVKEVVLVIGGIFYVYYVSSPITEKIISLSVRKTNEFTMIDIPKEKVLNYLSKFMIPLSDQIEKSKQRFIKPDSDNEKNK